MGYVYIASITSIAILATILLALRAETIRRQEVYKTLKAFTHLDPDQVLYSNGNGIALDYHEKMVCMLSVTGGKIKVSVIPFANVLASQVYSNDKERFRSVRSAVVERKLIENEVITTYKYTQIAPTDSNLAARNTVYCIVFDVENKRAIRHSVDTSNMIEAHQWHVMLRDIIENRDSSEVSDRQQDSAISSPPVKQPAKKLNEIPSSVAFLNIGTRGDGVCNEKMERPAAKTSIKLQQPNLQFIQLGGSSNTISQTNSASKIDKNMRTISDEGADVEEELHASALPEPNTPLQNEYRNNVVKSDKELRQEYCDRLLSPMATLLQNKLKHKNRVMIRELHLLDECGIEMAVLRFHDCMNYFKRNKTFPGIALSFSRKTEAWTISRRKS